MWKVIIWLYTIIQWYFTCLGEWDTIKTVKPKTCWACALKDGNSVLPKTGEVMWGLGVISFSTVQVWIHRSKQLLLCLRKRNIHLVKSSMASGSQGCASVSGGPGSVISFPRCAISPYSVSTKPVHSFHSPLYGTGPQLGELQLFIYKLTMS